MGINDHPAIYLLIHIYIYFLYIYILFYSLHDLIIHLFLIMFFFIIFSSDTRTTNWFLMSSPFPTLFICLSYVYLVKVVGPKFMENRKPLQLKNVLIAYNLFQVIFSAWLFYEVRKIVNFYLHIKKKHLNGGLNSTENVHEIFPQFTIEFFLPGNGFDYFKVCSLILFMLIK